MDSFYDREAGVAWGPITKQEMLDDILLYGKKNVKHRFTLSCDPSFSDDKEERFLQIMHKNTDPPNDDGILVISSDDEIEELRLDQIDNRTNKSNQDRDSLDNSDIENNDEESQFIDSLKENSINTTFQNNMNKADIVCSEASNLHLQPDIQNRLPTPANLDDHTYDDILDSDQEKNALDNSINISYRDYDSLNQSDIKNDGNEFQLMSNLKESPINTYNYPTLSNNINEVDVVCNEVSNLHLQPDIQNRLLTPANLDEYTYNGVIDFEQEKNALDNSIKKSSYDDVSLDKCDIKSDVESQLMGNLNENAINTYNYLILYNKINEIDIVYDNNLRLPPDVKNRLPTPASLDENNDSLDLDEEKIILGSTGNLSLRSNLNHGTYTSQYYHTPEKDRSLSEVEHSQCFPDTSQEVHEDTTNNMSANHLEDNSLLNDTIEEMERLLNEGLKTMSFEKYNNENTENYVNREESITPRTPTNAVMLTPTSNAPTINIIPSSEIKESSLYYKSNYSNSSTKGAIKKLPMKNFATKIPVIPAYVHNTKPFTKPALTPTNHNKHNINAGSAPASLRKRFKNIESPISVYIKNSGVTPLYKKITPSKPLTSNKIKSEKITKTNKENSIMFPEVVYKPAKRAIVTKSNDFKLPTKIESLISQKSNVIKHEGRIGTDGTRKNCILVNKKLSDVNLTIDSNASLDSIEDISIRYAKKAYIK